MNVVERYLVLGLRMGRHVHGVVDAYFGPPALAAEVDGEELAEPAALVAEADALLVDAEPDTWLHDQLRGLRTYAGLLAGEILTYTEEVEGCYGVRPELTAEVELAAAHRRLEELLPGDGSLAERFARWREQQFVPSEAILAAAEDIAALLRDRTGALVDLPDGEDIVLDPVSDEPWQAFNYYSGDLRSRIAINVDLPWTGPELVELVAHEAYPGHHTEHVSKEQGLVRDRGLLEEAILLVPTPQAVVSEGTAETGLEVLGTGTEQELETILARHGVEVELASTRQVARAREVLRGVGVNAALLIHEQGMSTEEAAEYVARWRAVSAEYAASTVRFVTDPTWRAYAITYTAGRDLCRAYHGGDGGRFRRLLTEQVRVRDLRAELSSAS